MVEVMDKGTNKKMMAMILCAIAYQGDNYLVYCIRRNKNEANIFISKMLNGTLGYTINDDFSNGEKESLDNIINKLLNKESIEQLESEGFSIIKDIKLDSNLTFNIERCYVSTALRQLIKDCLIFYNLVNEKMLDQPIIEVVDDNRKFNEGFASSIVLIVFGIFILIFSCIVIFGVVFS